MPSLPDRVTAWAVVSGLMLALAFPRPDLAPLAWVALVPLVLVMERHPFRSGFVAGVAFFGTVLYWLNIVMTTYGKLHPVFSVAAYLMLVVYLALYFGAATWASSRLAEHLQLPIALTLPVSWTGLEFLRAHLFTGFPWASLGYSQQDLLPLIQSADLAGVYGLTFLLVLVNAAMARLVRSVALGRWKELSPVATAAAALLFLGNAGYGYWQLSRPLDERSRQLDVALIQGNVDQNVKWLPGMRQATVEKYLRLSLEADRDHPADLIIWPEAATPFFFQEGGELARPVFQASRRTDALLLVGSPAYETVNRQRRFLNSAFLLSPEGRTLGRSDKVHLVPFGEYVPLAPLLPFIDKLVEGIGDYSPGTVTPLPMNGDDLGVLVCYEVIFPELAREWVRKGSDLLVNITNDAWFGRSSAPYQHLAMARFRAVENRIWLPRAANTGISALIAPSGRVISRTPIFETTFLNGTVGLGSRSTFYTRFGDLLPVGCLALGLYWLLQTRRHYPGGD